nr:immunoglobulin light chain junction region [Macaca mulatta]
DYYCGAWDSSLSVNWVF